MSTLRKRKASSVTLPFSARDNPERLWVPITSKSGRVRETDVLITCMGEPSSARNDQRLLPRSLDTEKLGKLGERHVVLAPDIFVDGGRVSTGADHPRLSHR